MLKRMELVGFKSFADKTAFEFGHGITAIVGPNGSGKSNVVDAVRWLLGEQSAKSLRGGEMTDVIFNGSASRRSFGMAEVTVTFDNSRQLLAAETEEVQITRRVYRSGEGEYLINRQPCRLKDIKDLFLGSGAGSGAYCIIAQGKVDVLLQASTRERRLIFEEAAGISRFKVKKIESLRKLERVDLNVQRLRDIIDEVEKQLRSVKLQAAKAQRFQEHSARLKQLRVGLGLQEYRQLTDELQEKWQSLKKLREGLDHHGSQVADWEAENKKLEQTLTRLEDELHHAESVWANAGQQIKAQETTLEHERQLTDDLQVELARLRGHVNELTGHLNRLCSQCDVAQDEVAVARTQAALQRNAVSKCAEMVQSTEENQQELQQQIKTDKASHLEQMRQAARLQNDAVSYKAQIDNLERELRRLRQKSEQVAESLASLDDELKEMTEAEAALQDRLDGGRGGLLAEQQKRDRLRLSRDEIGSQISQNREDRSGLVSRAEVLEGLERSHEGLSAGVKEVLNLLESSRGADEIWQRCIIGMAADCLNVQHEYAPLIDLALGDRTQRFLVRDADSFAKALASRGEAFSGRVTFMPVSGAQSDGKPIDALANSNLSNLPGLVAPAHQMVTCDHPELKELPQRLLARTLIVKDLDAARAIAAQAPGFRLITLEGELLEPDGTMTIGSHHADGGILSRKSELREIRRKTQSLDIQIGQLEKELDKTREGLSVSESRIEKQQQEIAVLTEQAADLRSRVEMHRDRRQGLHEEVEISRDEIQRGEEEESALRESWQQAQEQAAGAERLVHALYERIEQTEADVRGLEQQKHAGQQLWTAKKVILAQIEERAASLDSKYRQLYDDLEQRRGEHKQSEQNLQACRQRLADSRRAQLVASSVLAQWSVTRQSVQSDIVRMQQTRDGARDRRNELSEKLQTVRSEWQERNEQFHNHELQANELEHKRQTLSERLHEDYQIDVGELFQEAIDGGLWSEAATAEVVVEAESAPAEDAEEPLTPVAWQIPADVESAHEEIAELRSKLQRLGSVNLDALKELEKLELRAAALNTQYDDLTTAKRSLEEIIHTINNDSERLFLEAFEAIRGHFQELFRKLFGGGMADVVLEDETDVLESGIEIVARPPGKELRSISLMSGGEKTLTAVALLLAIFRSKPSPFCILDEVDAALDEANIGRFADVLREFLDQSHFIIVTHAKRTMATADVIYGITMQESGISKRVAVRFEDWPEEGVNPSPVPTSEAG